MSIKRELRQNFCQAIEVWRQHGHGFEECWLTPECAVLRYAQSVGCRFEHAAEQQADDVIACETRSDQDMLSRWESANHTQAARALLWPCGEPERKLPEWQLTQVTQIMSGLIHAVRAGEALANHHLDLDAFGQTASLPEEFVHRAAACLKSYHTAWPLLTQTLFADRNAVGTTTSASLTKHSPPARIALQLLAGHPDFTAYDQLTASSALMLCRLLNYLLANVWTQPAPRIEPFANHGKMLLATRGHDTAEIGRVEIVAADEGQNGVYLDPVAMGLRVIDTAMQSSLRLAWRSCLPDIRSRQQTGETTAVRFSPELHGVTVLEGGSAGGLFACGMLAAATRTPLNQDVTASIALDASNPDNPAPHQISVLAVHEDSIDAKLDIAARHGLSVVLEAGQAEKKQQDRGNAPPEIRAASNLWQAFRQLTGDARKEAVLKAYASACVETWETQPERAGGRPERFIEPHFAHVPPEHELLDGQEHAARAASGEAASREAKLGDRYQPLLDEEARAAVTPETSAQVGAVELIQLLNLGQHLCLAEDANAGKTIFTHWLKAFCAGPAGQQALFDNRPPLVFRWENRQGRVHWPNGDDRREVESRLRQDLESAVAPFCRIGNETVAAGEVVEYALDRSRVLLIFDAADQVDERDQLLNVLLTDSRLSHCRVVVTGRSFVFRSTEGAKQFPRDRWQFTTCLRHQVMCPSLRNHHRGSPWVRRVFWRVVRRRR